MDADTATPPLVPEPFAGLSREDVLSAAAVVFAVDSRSARRAAQLLDALADPAAVWDREDALLNRAPEAVAYLSGARLDRLFELAGNLALARLDDGRLLLLVQRGGRWFFLDGHGEAVAEYPAWPAGLTPSRIRETLLLSLRIEQPPALEAVEALRRVLRLAWAEVGLASLFINAGLLALPLFSMLIYNKVVYNKIYSTLWALTLGMLLFLAVDVAMRLIRNWATERIAADFSQRDDERIWRTLLAQNETPKGGFARLLSNYRDLAAVRDFVSSGYLLSLADAPFFFLYWLTIAIIAWPLALLLLVLAAGYASLGWRNQATLRQQSREAEQSALRKTAFLGETLEALDVVRLSPGAGRFDQRWRVLCRELAERESGRRLAVGSGTVLTIGMATATSLAMLVAGVYLIDLQITTVGGLIAVSLLSGRAMALISSLFSAITKMQDFRRSVSRLEEALSEEADHAGLARPTASGRLQVVGLCKRYAGRPPVLENVSMTVAPGEQLALLGRPGAGKTTLMRCLARLTEADSGQVLFDSADIHAIERHDMRRWLAYKGQDPVVFAGTLEDNLRIALAPVDLLGSRRLDGALWASGLEEELRAGRLSLSMSLDEQGRNLSGGQRQKVALARALAQGARFLFLDEPSLGLDPEAERQVVERLPQIREADDVLIVISHSVAWLSLTPRVVVLDGGRIVADGERDRIVRPG